MSQSEDKFQQQVTDFSNKMNDAVQVAHSLLEQQLAKHEGDLPAEIKKQLADLKKKMNDGHNN